MLIIHNITAPGGVPRDITVRALRLRELHVTWQVMHFKLHLFDHII